MKYLFEFMKPIIKLIYGVFVFIFGNIIFVLLHCLWNFEFPTKTSIIEFNEHYRRIGDNTIYYHTYLNYLFYYKGFTKMYK